MSLDRINLLLACPFFSCFVLYPYFNRTNWLENVVHMEHNDGRISLFVMEQDTAWRLSSTKSVNYCYHLIPNYLPRWTPVTDCTVFRNCIITTFSLLSKASSSLSIDCFWWLPLKHVPVSRPTISWFMSLALYKQLKSHWLRPLVQSKVVELAFQSNCQYRINIGRSCFIIVHCHSRYHC